MKNYSRNLQNLILSKNEINPKSYNKQIYDILNSNKLSINEILNVNFISFRKYQGKTYLILDKSFFDEINSGDYNKIITKILVSLKINNKSIDYIKLPDNLSKESKREIYGIIYENFPILSIDRIGKGDNLVNLNFFGIKQLNDDVGKEIVDEFINSLKKYIISNFDNHNKNGRLLLTSYKNILFSYSGSDNIIGELLGDIKNIGFLIDFIFKNYFNLNVLNGKNIELVKKSFYDKFNLGFGYDKINNDNNFSKLISYYKSNMGSKKNFNNKDEFILNNYDIGKIKTISDIIIKTKDLIIENFNTDKVNIDGIDFDIIVNLDGNLSINDKILSYYRKGGKNLPKILLDMLSLYFTLLNENFDFFTPISYGKSLYYKIDIELLKDGYINTLFFEQNYKGFYNINFFNEYSKNTKGFNCFIDVVDMGVSNINDSINLCSKINNGELAGKYIDKGLLNGGKSGTKNIYRFAKQIQNKYKDVKISIGGDEIYLDFNISNISHKILEDINLLCTEIGLKTRICYGNNLEIGYDSLDELTKINKYFEKKLSKFIFNSGLNNKIIDLNFELFIKPSFSEFVIKNIDAFISEIDSKLNTNLLSNLLLKNNTDKIIISEFKLNEINYLGMYEINNTHNFNISLNKISEINDKGVTSMKYKIIIA
ncbi:MAG: hypothetical protein Q8K30_01385 [Candidatus Gracilibacteria bacterium]|nr:hypothetical protein [Candidatus Gracilibacteria bacterium]